MKKIKNIKSVLILITAFLSLLTHDIAMHFFNAIYSDYTQTVDGGTVTSITIDAKYYIDYVLSHTTVILFFIIVLYAISKLKTD